MTVKIGAKNDGTLTAIDYKSLGSNGAYPYGAGTGTLAAYLYTCRQRSDRGHHGLHQRRQGAADARAGLSRRARGPSSRRWTSSPQKLDIDPVELRLQNIADGVPGRGRHALHLEPARGLPEKGAAEAFGWNDGPSDELRTTATSVAVSASPPASGATPAGRRRPSSSSSSPTAASTSTWAPPTSAPAPRPGPP